VIEPEGGVGCGTEGEESDWFGDGGRHDCFGFDAFDSSMFSRLRLL
jgi:hypothetical protein